MSMYTSEKHNNSLKGCRFDNKSVTNLTMYYLEAGLFHNGRDSHKLFHVLCHSRIDKTLYVSSPFYEHLAISKGEHRSHEENLFCHQLATYHPLFFELLHILMVACLLR